MKPRILIKIGGRAFDGRDGFRALAQAIRNHREAEVIIVHGGGKEISQALKDADRETVFVDGIRVTPAEDMEIVEEVLSGKVNARIASWLEQGGIACRRMSGKTDRLLVVEPLIHRGRDLGFVGRVIQVNPKPLLDSLAKGEVPVVSPISVDREGKSYNVNADSAAAALAVASRCTDLVYFTDVSGVQVGAQIRPLLTVEEAKRLIARGTIKGGMVAKMESAFEALRGQVQRVHITRWHGMSTFESMVRRQPVPGTTIRF
ncbi:MAG: acetylglutamate kinase [Deltaproteobacteria bacterium]|nr:acetylglutamate kinase [Deltaproteobacteria bacterium]